MLMLTPASAQTWTGPDPERQPRRFGQGDIDFALSELCFPFILQNADPAELVRQRRLPQGFGDRGWAGGQPFYLVGQADVWVSFNFSPLELSCSISIAAGDVNQYRAAIEARLATSPAPFTLSPYRHPPRNFAERLTYCGPANGPHYQVLISLGARHRAAIVTIAQFPNRDPRCDAPPPQAQ